MKERFGVAVEEGTVEKLRTLAGGERKVGAYLSDIVSWLWQYKEALGTRPLSDYAPVQREWLKSYSTDPEAIDEALELGAELFWRKQYRELASRIEALEVQVSDTVKVTDSAEARPPS